MKTRNDYDDNVRQIKMYAKNVDVECNQLIVRLNNFEQDVVTIDDKVDHLSDADVIFMMNEVGRFRNSLNSVKANKDYHLTHSMEMLVKQNQVGLVEPTEVTHLTHHKNSVEKLQSVDI